MMRVIFVVYRFVALYPLPLPRPRLDGHLVCVSTLCVCLYLGREAYEQRRAGDRQSDGSARDFCVEGDARGVQSLSRRAVGRGRPCVQLRFQLVTAISLWVVFVEAWATVCM